MSDIKDKPELEELDHPAVPGFYLVFMTVSFVMFVYLLIILSV